ncbi:TolC family protein [Erythrobacter sp.]|jgi:adhesin transport system outer membrane protein|uniref:TolC family protein n=1 Tax=Erythrobacter sp. TaxID=1042 RepID=UPI002EC81E0B|nr:TolC family protein [Erythrobacter sp.]
MTQAQSGGTRLTRARVLAVVSLGVATAGFAGGGMHARAATFPASLSDIAALSDAALGTLVATDAGGVGPRADLAQFGAQEVSEPGRRRAGNGAADIQAIDPDANMDDTPQGDAPIRLGEVEDVFPPASAELDPEAPPATDPDGVAEVYGPPTQREAIEYPEGVPPDLALGVALALDEYPAIRAARLQEEASDQEVRAAKGQRLPTVTVDGQGLGGGTAIVEDQQLALNVTVLQPLWSGGRIDAAIDRARAAREVSLAQTLETGESIAIQTINAFYEALLARRRMLALEEGNNQLTDLVGSIERRVDQSVSPRADLTLVLSRQAEIQRQYQVAQATFLSARETYRQFTGQFDYRLDEIPPYLGEAAHPDLDTAIADAETCNPLLRRLNAEAVLAEAEVEVAQKELFPTVSAQLSRNEITGTRYGIVVRSALNNGLSQFRLVDASRARQLQASTNILTAARETRVRLTEDLLLNYSSREQIPIVRTAVEAASDLTVSYRRQFVAGRRSWLDVVNAVREEITADLNLVDAETSAMASGARILIYTCRWTPAIGS